MLHNCAVHFAVESETADEVEALLAKILAATSRQPGVVFAYQTHVASPSAAKDEQKALEELFER